MTLLWLALFGGLGFAGTIGLWRAQKLMYAGMSFLTTLLALALIFVLLGGEFVGVAQVVVYVGGILVLLLFGMMFMSAGNPEVLDVRPKTSFLLVLLPILITAGLLREVWAAAETLPQTEGQTHLSAKQLGVELIGFQLLNFELIALLLLVVLIGATFIASRD